MRKKRPLISFPKRQKSLIKNIDETSKLKKQQEDRINSTNKFNENKINHQYYFQTNINNI